MIAGLWILLGDAFFSILDRAMDRLRCVIR